jgi:hypothetical protein
MKALSVKQPWATLIASGKKTIEIRVWPTEYRGDLLICSSKKIDAPAAKAFQEDLFSEHIEYEFPVGVALCIAELYDCKPMTEKDEEKAMCGIYGEGRWKARSFFLRNIRPIKPFPVIGELGIFNVELPKGVLPNENY